MTCIIGYRHRGTVFLAGDSAAVSPYDLESFVVRDSKVFAIKDILFGYTTSFRMGQLLKHKFKAPRHKPNVSVQSYIRTSVMDEIIRVFEAGKFIQIEDAKASGGEFIIGYRGHIFVVQNDFSALEIETPFLAVGCGAQFAVGAMHALLRTPEAKNPRSMLRKAMQAAIDSSAGVRPPVRIVSAASRE